MRRTSWTIWGIGVALCSTLLGCASRDAGYKISEDTVAFIQPGTTTRAEVVENLGEPLFESRKPSVLAYSWGKVHASGSNVAARQEVAQSRQMTFGSYNATSGSPDEGALVETRRWVFCIALDEGKHVTRSGRLKLEPGDSLEQAVLNWAAGGAAK